MSKLELRLVSLLDRMMIFIICVVALYSWVLVC